MFGKKAAKKPPAACLLLSRDSSLLARGELMGSHDGPEIRVKVSGDGIAAVAGAEIIQVIPSDKTRAPRMGRVRHRLGDILVLEPMRDLGEKVRQNFRIPVDFESFLYPKEGGRAAIRAIDLSCGGIAMCADYTLAPGEICEVVVPITSEGPLIVDCEVLRVLPADENGLPRYAAKFVDLIHDQEAALREAVFQTQVQSALAAKRKRK